MFYGQQDMRICFQTLERPESSENVADGSGGVVIEHVQWTVEHVPWSIEPVLQP